MIKGYSFLSLPDSSKWRAVAAGGGGHNTLCTCGHTPHHPLHVANHKFHIQENTCCLHTSEYNNINMTCLWHTRREVTLVACRRGTFKGPSTKSPPPSPPTICLRRRETRVKRYFPIWKYLPNAFRVIQHSSIAFMLITKTLIGHAVPSLRVLYAWLIQVYWLVWLIYCRSWDTWPSVRLNRHTA